MSEGPISEEIAAIEAALGSLTPAAGGLDRDRVMFLAGRVSGERLQPARPVAARRWPSVMAASLVAMTSATAVLLVLLMVRPGLPTADRKFGPGATSFAPLQTTASNVADDAYRAAFQRRNEDNRRVLTGGDATLPKDFFSTANGLASSAAVPADRREAGERPLSSSELMQRVLHEPARADDPLDRSIL